MASVRSIHPITGIEVEAWIGDDLREELNAHYNFVCSHESSSIKRVKYSNEAEHIHRLCLECGQFISQGMSKSTPVDNKVYDFEAQIREYKFDRDLKFHELVKKFADRQKLTSADFKKEYLKYLASDEWKVIREKVLLRENHICEGCGVNKATEVHHLTYVRMKEELLFDLKAVCRDCHLKCHPERKPDGELDYFDDNPCISCRYYGSSEESNSWCIVHDKHSVAAILDAELCGPNLSSFEGLK
jgi:hypothetical protein